VTATFAKYSASLQESSAEFVQQQQAMSAEASRQAAELKAELKSQFDAYSKESQQKAGDATNEIRSKAEAMEKVMHAYIVCFVCFSIFLICIFFNELCCVVFLCRL
jgi:tellurite resistance protein